MLLSQILQSDGLMQHRLLVKSVPDRKLWLAEKCQDKTVLHVGCCDVPVFDPNHNLHIDLSRTTERLDGLDISEAGLSELRRHVFSDYFSAPHQVNKEYDLVLVPEVLEHTENPHQFLQGIFSIRARSYLITAPDIQWYDATRREGEAFIEQVHGDHKAWYSPYTLLNCVRPFLNETTDQIELSLIEKLGSVAIEVNTGRDVAPWTRAMEGADSSPRDLVAAATSLLERGETAQALYILQRRTELEDDEEVYSMRANTLLHLGRHLDAFRVSVEFMKRHPSHSGCLHLAARAAEGLGQHAQAQQLRHLAQ